MFWADDCIKLPIIPFSSLVELKYLEKCLSKDT